MGMERKNRGVMGQKGERTRVCVKGQKGGLVAATFTGSYPPFSNLICPLALLGFAAAKFLAQAQEDPYLIGQPARK